MTGARDHGLVLGRLLAQDWIHPESLDRDPQTDSQHSTEEEMAQDQTVVPRAHYEGRP